ncbi:unnamed protein product [Ilex paraguariensis]|uniref:PGG domain-containing protein n=2 Tax=Ilex paraguariensis TaxID=185542 RepID=A0ABC8S4W0_9AQUA
MAFGVLFQEESQNPKNSPLHDEWKRKNALALHAIQLSCGSGIYSKFKEAHVSADYAWHHLAEKRRRPPAAMVLTDHEEEGHSEHNGTEHHQYEELYKAVEKGDWKETHHILQREPNAVRAIISSHKDTALHVAILCGHTKIAEELVRLMKPEDLELTNEFGATALSLAAISGETKLAKAMVRKNDKLVRVAHDHDDGNLPVIVAALYGRRRMVRYLYSKTPKDELSPERGEHGATLLNCLITADIYDVASMLLKRYPHLGVVRDHYGNYTLRMLAHKPSAFPSGSKYRMGSRAIIRLSHYSVSTTIRVIDMIYTLMGVTVHSPWDGQRWHHHGSVDVESNKIQGLSSDERSIEIHDSSDEELDGMPHKSPTVGGTIVNEGNTVAIAWFGLENFKMLPDIKHIHDRKLVHVEAVKLLSVIFKELPKLKKSQLESMEIDKAIYDAIKHGIIEFVDEILKYNPEIIWRKDNKGRTIFSNAIVLRQEKIFSLIYRLGTKKSIMARRHDVFGNNFLHLAAKLSPPTQLERVSGAAMQMQRELQWFKEVESMVQPKLKEEVNENNKTPGTLFTDEHQELAKEGERWMKNTAGSSMIVGTLIAAVMFTTAFTVPGGNNNKNGLPIMAETQPRAFLVFMVSNALSMFTSSTSVLMFLGILTARYAEEDFLKSLPTKLIFGLSCLFFSIVTMMVSFGASLYLILHQQLSWVSIPIIVFSIIPIALFTMLQFPLLLEMIYRTYVTGIFDKPKKHHLHLLH